MGKERLRLGIVGLGMASQPHALALAELTERIEVVGGFSPSADRRAIFAQKTGFPVVASLQDLLGDPGVEAILMLTPPTTHLDLIGLCAAAGKHVLMEKPIEVTLAQSIALVERMEQAKLRLGVVFQHRFRPVVQRLRAALAAGAIGELVAASAEIRWWRPPAYYAQPGRGMKARDGGGVLITQAIHSLDVFCTLAGTPVEVGCFARTSPMRQIDTEDIAAGMMRFANGAIGTIGATTAAYPGFPERIELSGTLGTATLEGNSLRLLTHDGREETLQGDGPTGGGADPMAFDHGPHKALIADFAAAVAEGREPDTSGRSALAVHRLIDALLRSSAEHQLVKVA
jgi:predicted dehydrogenase